MKVYIAHSIDILNLFKEVYEARSNIGKTKFTENRLMELVLIVTSDSYHIIQLKNTGVYQITLNVVPKKLHPRFNRLKLTPVTLNVKKNLVEKYSSECTDELMLKILGTVKDAMDDDSLDSMLPTYDAISEFINLKLN